jgi:hypothetical protein
MPLRALVLNSGPFPRPALPGVLGTPGLSATPGGPAWPSRASGWGHAPTARGFPCCVGSPLQACRRHCPGGTAGSGRFSGCDPHLPSGCGLPRFRGGSAPTSRISRPARRSLRLRPACSRSRLSDPLHRRLRRSRCLHRRSDCYRLERPSCRAGVAPLKIQAFPRRTQNCTLSPDAESDLVLKESPAGLNSPPWQAHRVGLGRQPGSARGHQRPCQGPRSSPPWLTGPIIIYFAHR